MRTSSLGCQSEHTHLYIHIYYIQSVTKVPCHPSRRLGTYVPNFQPLTFRDLCHDVLSLSLKFFVVNKITIELLFGVFTLFNSLTGSFSKGNTHSVQMCFKEYFFYFIMVFCSNLVLGSVRISGNTFDSFLVSELFVRAFLTLIAIQSRLPRWVRR